MRVYGTMRCTEHERSSIDNYTYWVHFGTSLYNTRYVILHHYQHNAHHDSTALVIVDVVNPRRLHNQSLRLVIRWLGRAPQHEGHLPAASVPQFVLPCFNIIECSTPRVTVVSGDAGRDRVLGIVENTNLSRRGCRCVQDEY